MIEFSDILYGTIKIPEWFEPFLKLPEFLRLRGVRLSNVDSYQFKDFNAPTRWEHSIAVAHLALRCAKKRNLSEPELVHLVLGALLHDVATPPFAHTAEYVLENFDHELESMRVLNTLSGQDFSPDIPIYASQFPQFLKTCKLLSKKLHFPVNPEEIAKGVIGEGNLGFLIHGTLDLDNADNVVRSLLYLGAPVERDLPIQLADWLSEQRHAPIYIENTEVEPVRKWLQCRNNLYQRFYTSSDEELGRQAFLQHLMRRAIQAGFPRISLIWNTDDGLLSSFEDFKPRGSAKAGKDLRELVQRYKLLESPFKIAHIDIEDEEILRMFCQPNVVAWIESQFLSSNFEPIVMVSVRRYKSKQTELLLPSAPGSLLMFKLGKGIQIDQLPRWLRAKLPEQALRKSPVNRISRAIQEQIKAWAQEKPWFSFSSARKDHLIANLEHIGDWSFRFTRNSSVHPYPSTFVYAIPANLISALNVRGELIIDPFGGIGQTAAEAVKQGSPTVSADSNSLACLCAKAKLTFFPPEDREFLRDISKSRLAKCNPCIPPDIDSIDKWFHPKTLEELCRIWQFINRVDEKCLREFLTVCFSAILTSCTARRGKHHTYFADNTPLPAQMAKPPYCDVYDAFLARVNHNIDIVERLYTSIERNNHDPKTELQRAKILWADARTATASDYGIAPNSAGAIITSPPYLCMADYTYGLRLSYAWIASDAMLNDFAHELGARRDRTKPQEAMEAYFEGLRKFARNAASFLRPGGFLATVYGSPAAKAFRSADVIGKFDSILHNESFNLIWYNWRSIQWRRGYGAINEERVAVHVLV